MKSKYFVTLAIIACLGLSACSDQNEGASNSNASSNEDISISESVIEVSKENSSALSRNEEKTHKAEVAFHWGGIGKAQQRSIVISCPTNWEEYDGGIDFDGKKLVELVCYSPEKMENKLERLETAEQKEIGGKNFWILSEEHSILEKPKQVPYIIWRYYYFDGELYYGISFFQNQENTVITPEDFEGVLATMEIKK